MNVSLQAGVSGRGILSRYKILGRQLEISSHQKQNSPGGNEGKCWDDMLQSERD